MAASWLVVTLSLPANPVTADHSDRAGVQACCLPLFSGRRDEGGGVQREKETEGAAGLFPSEFFTCLCAYTLAYFAVLTVILFCPCAISSACLCGYVPACPCCISTVNVCSVHSEYTPATLLLPEGFSVSSQALCTSTLLWPQWLILTQAAVVSNQHSQPRT